MLKSSGNRDHRAVNKLNDLDEKERLAAEVTKLHRAILRLAFAHYGENPELDQQLTRLGNTVRSGDKRVNLPKLIDDAVATIVGLDPAGKRNQDAAGASAVSVLLDKLVLRLNLDYTANPRLAALKRDLTAKPSATRLDELTDECARLLDTHIKTPPAGAQVRNARGSGDKTDASLLKEGFEHFLVGLSLPADSGLVPSLNGLRERIRQADEDAKVLALVAEAAREFSEALAGRPAVTESTPQSQQTQVGRETLLALLDQINFPADLHAKANEIETDLGRSLTDAELLRASRAVASLVQTAQSRAQREIEELAGFLKQVMTALAGLRRQMLTADHTRSASLRDSEMLSQSLCDHVLEIQTSVSHAGDLDELKNCISHNLEIIRKDVDTFVEAERKRNVETEQAVVRLSVQLQTLEGETLRLREGIEHERSRALTDPLTGLANRLGLDSYISAESERWKRDHGSLTIVVFDIDHFKTINDRYGHQTGDKVLKTVADQLRSQVRQSDFLARYGGEEFVLILPNTALKDGYQLAEKLRRHVLSCKFHYRNDQVPVTVSCGVAEFREGDTPETVFERADQALYIAKNEGRNRSHSEHDVACPVLKDDPAMQAATQ